MEGYCIRLFSETEFSKLEQHSTPEISSTDLVPTTLLLTEWGCTSYNDIGELPFLDVPPKDSLTKAYQMLVDLNALEEYRLANDRKKRYKLTSLCPKRGSLSMTSNSLPYCFIWVPRIV